MRKNVVGKLINFRGLVYAPVEENGVIFLFSKLTNDLNMYIETIRKGFPDCIAKRYAGKSQWEEVNIEFEFSSSDFKRHGHLESMAKGVKCDMIVCWEHDWADCPKEIEVLELKTEYCKYENQEIIEPDKIIKTNEFKNDKYYKRYPEMTKLYERFDSAISAVDDEIWKKYAKWGIFYYCPQKVFFNIKIQKQALKIHLFTGGKRIKGVEKLSVDGSYAQKWGRCYIRNSSEIKGSIVILKESLKRIKSAIKKGENTGWYAEVEE